MFPLLEGEKIRERKQNIHMELANLSARKNAPTD